MNFQFRTATSSICNHRCIDRRAAAAAAKVSAATRRVRCNHSINDAIVQVHNELEGLGACYMFTGATAAYIQGAAVPKQCMPQLAVTVQWDFMTQLHSHLMQKTVHQPWNQQSKHMAEPHKQKHTLPSSMVVQPGGQHFTACINGQHCCISCQLNTVVQMNPNRVAVHLDGKQIWCESLLAVRDSIGAPVQLVQCVQQRLQQLQAELTEANGRVWSQAETADAWFNKLGSPAEAAAWIQQDPLLRLGAPLYKHLPQQLKGIKLINLMGSHGTKAIAAAMLGAQAACVDLSDTNLQYGRQVAAAAGVQVEFVVSDVLELGMEHHESYDVVLLELGVLHYFIDLQPLVNVVQQLLAPGGQLLLREFHPVSTKLVTSKGKKHKVTGNYFSQDLVESDVAYSKYSAGSSANPKDLGLATADELHAQKASASKQHTARVCLRQWGLGEVVSSVAAAGLVVQCLEEEPGVKLADAGLPKLYTLVARKPVS